MIERTDTQRIFLVEGNPWKDALIAYLEPRSPYRPWFGNADIRAGDVLVTVLNTEPRTVLCVERAGTDAQGRDGFNVVDRWECAGLPELSEVERSANTSIPTNPARLDDKVGDKVLAALGVVVDFSEPLRRGDEPADSTAIEARVLLRSRGVCTGCERPLNLRKRSARSDIHVHAYAADDDPLDRRPALDWSATLCKECRAAMTAAKYETFLEYRYSLHPACPRCSAAVTMLPEFGLRFPGMPSSPPWVVECGCVILGDEPRWICGACDYGWSFNVDPRFDDEFNARSGELVTAKHFNFDGRRLPRVFPPDVDYPEETLVGVLVIEEVESAWGGYTRYAIVLDDGAVREVEPDTIAASSRFATRT